jgi:hypothetical protein
MVKMAELDGHTSRVLFMAQVNARANILQSAFVHVNMNFANVLVYAEIAEP